MSTDSQQLLLPEQAAELAYRRAIEAVAERGSGSTGRVINDQGGSFVAGVIVFVGEDQERLYQALSQVAQKLLAQGILQSATKKVTH